MRHRDTRPARTDYFLSPLCFLIESLPSMKISYESWTIRSRIARDTDAAQKNLDGVASKADVYFLLNVLVRDAVKHFIHRNMVVVRHHADFPLRQLKRSVRQNLEHGLLILKEYAFATAYLFLKRLVVKLLQLFENGFVQLPQREKSPVPQRSDDPCGDNADRSFDRGLILRLANSCGYDSSAIMLCHLVIAFVDDGGIPLHSIYSGLEIVRNQNPCNATEVFVGTQMCGNPVLQIAGDKALHIGVTAVWQHCNKDVYGNTATGDVVCELCDTLDPPLAYAWTYLCVLFTSTLSPK